MISNSFVIKVLLPTGADPNIIADGNNNSSPLHSGQSQLNLLNYYLNKEIELKHCYQCITLPRNADPNIANSVEFVKLLNVYSK